MTEVNPNNPNDRDIIFHAGGFANVKLPLWLN